MIAFQLCLLMILALGLEGSLQSPEFKYENGEEVAPPFCREASPEERIADGFGPQGKASSFNIWGYYRCEHNVFEYGERNSFYDFVVNHASKRADEVALKIAKISDLNHLSGEPDLLENQSQLRTRHALKIEVISDAEPVIKHLNAVFQAALVQHAPKVQVLRLVDTGRNYSTLRVVVRRLDDIQQFIGVSLQKSSSPKQEWVEL